jgi:hypothetical protein
MKTTVFCVMAVALLCLACCFGNNPMPELPGDKIGDGDLAKVWAAHTNPSGTGSGQCSVTYGTTCSGGGVGVGTPCCGIQYGLGDITCTGTPSTQEFVGGTEACIASKSVVACEYPTHSLVLRCTGTVTIGPAGSRSYCRTTGHNLPREP